MSKINSPILTIPGISYRMGGHDYLHDIRRLFKLRLSDKILAYAGLSRLLTNPGNLIKLLCTYGERGSKYLRYALFNTAKFVCRWDQAFAAYLSKKRAEGKHYNVAISHAAKKLVRVIFALEKTGQTYRTAA